MIPEAEASPFVDRQVLANVMQYQTQNRTMWTCNEGTFVGGYLSECYLIIGTDFATTRQ